MPKKRTTGKAKGEIGPISVRGENPLKMPCEWCPKVTPYCFRVPVALDRKDPHAISIFRVICADCWFEMTPLEQESLLGLLYPRRVNRGSPAKDNMDARSPRLPLFPDLQKE